MPPNTQTRTLRVVVDAGDSKVQLQKVADGMKAVSQNTRKMASDLGVLSGSFSAFLGYVSVRQLAAFSDEMQNLTNRLKILTGSQEEASNTLQKLLALSGSLNTSVADLGETYTRLGVALKDTNISTDALLQLTEVLQNSFRISGATANETSSTIIQLSQAFSRGALQGQELRSVMLQNATVAGLLRERFGKNLAEDAEKGLISISAVMEVLLKNQDKINESAKKLTPTFENTMVKAIGQLKYALGKLNEQYELSIKFATVMTGVTENLGLIILSVALVALPALTLSLARFALANPILAKAAIVLGAIAYAVSLTGEASDSFTTKLIKLQAKLYDFIAVLIKARVAYREFNNEYFGFLRKRDQKQDYQNDTDLLAGLAIDYRNSAAALRKNAVELPKPSEDKDALQKYVDGLKAAAALSGKQAKAKDLLAELNKEYLYGTLVVSEYNEKLAEIEMTKLNQEFEQGKKDLSAYTSALEALERKELSKQFTEGAISLRDFNAAVESSKIAELNSKLAEGSITLLAYNEELTKISNTLSPGGVLAVGTQSYLDSLGTTSSQIADGIKSAFGSLETNFMGFIKTGKFEFAKFTEAILDDLLKIVIRASILQPLAQGITGFFTSAPTGAAGGAYTNYPTPLQSANGNAFSGGNVIPFARGGLVNSPTLFGYGGSKTGVMGEAGPEAILPLSRGSGGKLGVQASVTPVTVNIINNTPADVQTRETTGPSGDRQIEILIATKVKEGLGTGAYDKVLNQSYGLQRRGS